MIRPTEEMLNAYVDGALDSEAERVVADYLIQNPDARAYVDALRRLNASMPDAAAELVPDPPQALVDKINDMMDLSERKASSATSLRSRFVRLALRQPFAIAAMLIMALGLAIAYTTLTRPDASADFLAVGPLVEGSAIATLLERGQPHDAIAASVAKGGNIMRVTLASTFVDKQGRYCREIEIGALAEGRQSASIACRATRGSWAVEGSVALAPDSRVTAPGIAPSGSDEQEPLAVLLRSLGAGRALSSQQIETAVSNGWK